MSDAYLRKWIEPVTQPVAAWLARAGVSAETLTTAAFVFGLGAVAEIATHRYLWGAGLLVASRLIDAFDGSVARHGAETVPGAFLDTVLDTIFWAAMAFGFALAVPESALAATFLIFGFVASAAPLLAAGIVGPLAPIGGTVERLVKFLALGFACAMPERFALVAYILGALSFVLAGLRVAYAMMGLQRP